MGRRIVVLGSSFGGYNTALALKKRLGADADVTVVSKEDVFTFIPSLPWVAAGWREPDAIQFPVAGGLKSRGITFVQDTITAAEPERNRVIGAKGRYEYDYLAAATGAELDFSAVPGSDPAEGVCHTIFTVDQALAARDALSGVISKGEGSLVFVNLQGASCLGPVYEMAMIADSLLRRRGTRSRFRITLLTNEPFLGHFGVGGFGAMTRMLEDEFADRDIRWRVNLQTARITDSAVELSDGSSIESDFTLAVPPFFGSHAYMGVEGLSNPRGFIPVDDYLANPRHPNVYAVGVAMALAPPEATPVPVGVPKTGHMTESMAMAAARNIAADIRGGEKARGKDFSVVCIADGGDTGFYLAASPLLPPRDRLSHKEGKWARLMKVAFEKYYMASLRHGLPRMDFGW